MVVWVLCTMSFSWYEGSHLLVQPVPSPFSHTPPSPSTLHIVLSPVSLSVINYERHKPPGLMLRRGCLPNCTFLESQKAAFIDNAGHTVRLPLYWQAEKHKTGPSQAQKTPALFGAYFYKTTAECFIYVGLLVLLLGKKACPHLENIYWLKS